LFFFLSRFSSPRWSLSPPPAVSGGSFMNPPRDLRVVPTPQLVPLPSFSPSFRASAPSVRTAFFFCHDFWTLCKRRFFSLVLFPPFPLSFCSPLFAPCWSSCTHQPVGAAFSLIAVGFLFLDPFGFLFRCSRRTPLSFTRFRSRRHLGIFEACRGRSRFCFSSFPLPHRPRSVVSFEEAEK